MLPMSQLLRKSWMLEQAVLQCPAAHKTDDPHRPRRTIAGL